MPIRLKLGFPSEPVVGSGQFGIRCERMHRLKFTIRLSVCRDVAGLDWPLFGSRRAQAVWAAAN